MSCPICGEAPVERFRPFCSKRCADIDLGRWFNGAYAVPADGPDETGEPEGTAPDIAQTPSGPH